MSFKENILDPPGDPRLLGNRGNDPTFQNQTPMKQSELSNFKQLLLAEKETVTQCLEHQKEEIDETNDEVLEPLTESEEKLLEKIELALMKIENGSYGMCVNCSREIPKARLEAKPSVSLCLDCQSEHETA